MEENLFIHNIRDMKVLHTIRDTPPNPSGLCALSIDSENCYLAYPGSNQIGEVQIFDTVNLVSTSVYALKRMKLSQTRYHVRDACQCLIVYRDFSSLQRAVTMIPAHDNPLAAMVFNAQGTKIATASEKVP